MNRLNLMNMVSKNMHNHGEMKFFNSTEIDLKDYYDSERYNRKIELTDKHDIAEKVNYFMAQVHNQLNNRKPSTAKPVKKAEKLKEKSAERVMKTKKKVTMSDNQQKCNSLPVDSAENEEVSKIPRLKAVCFRKTQKRTTPPSNSLNSEKRVQDVLQHNVVLENMLEEHKQLKQDRQSIAQEITVMRGSLEGIRGRLKSSIKKLDDKKTYCELHGLSSCKSCKK